MRLSDEQRHAVAQASHILVDACPGSGKTRALVAKLLITVEEVRDSSRLVACITYTNAAVAEIDDRLHRFGRLGDDDFCDISTIHSFCLQQILRPFGWMLPELAGGFRVLPSDSEEYAEIVGEVANQFRLSPKDCEKFENVHRACDGSPVVDGLSPHAVLDFWQRLQSVGAIDFPNILYYAYRLLNEQPFVARSVAARYKWILVDEVQDTTDLQVEILRLIAAWEKSQFFLVGDRNQSIFRFAGAVPQTIVDFAGELGARTDIAFTSNFRSSQHIVSAAERLIARPRPMVARGSQADFHVAPQFHVVDSAFQGVVDYFLPAIEELGIPLGSCAVLAAWWPPLYNLGCKLRDYGVPIVGPGSRPYKRKHAFAGLAEHLCVALDADNFAHIRAIQRELFLLRESLTGTRSFLPFSYEGSCLAQRLVRFARVTNSETGGAGVAWMRMAVSGVADLLCQYEVLRPNDAAVLAQSVEEMLADMRRKNIDLENLSTTDLGLFANSRHSLHLLTMHKAKGREYEAVAIVDTHEGRVPNYNARTIDDVEDGRRQLYVATTRPSRLLMIFCDTSDSRNRPSRFLSSVFPIRRHDDVAE